MEPITQGSNLAVVHIFNSLSSCYDRVIQLVCAFTLCCLRLNILFRARHVPRLKNELADALSHQQMERFRSLASRAQPDVLPLEVWSTGGQKLPDAQR